MPDDCELYPDKIHRVVFQRDESEACAIYACHCGFERAWADVDATNRRGANYAIIEPDEEAELLGVTADAELEHHDFIDAMREQREQHREDNR